MLYSSIRKSLEEYVKLRIRDISSEIHQTFLNIKQIWRCGNTVDFLYGYYVVKIEEGTTLSFQTTRASARSLLMFLKLRKPLKHTEQI